MLQVARLAPKLLGESAELVAGFIRSRLSPQGGFVNREGRPDLYYTVFAIEALQALRAELPREQVLPWLRSFGTGDTLDLVHLCSLVRSAAALGGEIFSEEEKEKIATNLAAFRSADGGCHASRGNKTGSSYGALLTWGAHDDLGLHVPNEDRLLQSVMALQLEDGSFANEAGLTQGVSTASAAAVTLCRLMNHPLEAKTAAWLQQCFHPSGGFLVFPGVPMPDLLSTAVVLHALDGMEANFSALREPCLDFIDSLWSAEGGFHGNWTDDDLDCEYTYYGLLALGHLTL
jgi:prenyltransferase beta subunit